VPAAWNFRKSHKKVSALLDRVYGDINPIVRHLSTIADNVDYITTSIRVDVQQVNETIAMANQRLLKAVERAQELADEFNALLGVVQQEAEDVFVSTASTIRGDSRASIRWPALCPSGTSLIAAVTWFSVLTGLCGVAPNPETFGLLRFLAGVGLGGLVPSANALTSEFVSPRFRSGVSTIMMSGVPIGGSLAALLAIPAIPALGWRSMYLFALTAVGLLAVAAALLPESPAWLRANHRPDEARALERRYGLRQVAESATEHGPEVRPSVRTIVRPPFLGATVLFSVATVATLFAWYGLGTWLPKLMASDSRFEMGNPLTFLLALNLGAVAGSVVTAYAATRVGPLRSAVGAAAAAAVGLAFLLTYPSNEPMRYGALLLAGVGTHGTQCLIIAAVASHYPPRLRGTSLGFALGVGRVGAVAAPQVGGWLLAAGLGVGSNFLVFAGAAALAAVLLLVTFALTRPTLPRADAPAVAELVH